MTILIKRLLPWLVMLPFIFGFRLTLFKNHWDVSKEEPYIWVKFCDDPAKFSSYDFPEGDALYGAQPTLLEAVQSVLDDYNSIDSSVIRIELHPETSGAETSARHFDPDRAIGRTIDACWGAPNGTHTSHTEETYEGGYIKKCKLTMGWGKERHNARSFTGIFTHEMGHCLGLAHPQDTRKSIMSYHRNGIVRLQIDDKMGITALYPTDKSDEIEEATLGMQCAPKD